MNPAVIGLLALGAYLLYSYSQQSSATSTTGQAPQPNPLQNVLQSGGTPTGGRTPVSTTTMQTTVPTPPATGAPQSGAILATQIGTIGGSFLQKMMAEAGVDPAVKKGTDPYGSDITASFDVFNYYLGQVMGTSSLPNANQVLGATTVPILTLAQYWAAMRQWLLTNQSSLAGPAVVGVGMSSIRVPSWMSGGWR